MKNFIPEYCPACNTKLVIDFGKKNDVIKLMCKNPTCKGVILKKLQKGILALDIRGIGPSTIEKLLNAGITHSYDLFDSKKFNEITLVNSGEFQRGRALEKIIIAVKNTKSINIEKAILSLQIENIGKTFSKKIGQKLSGLFVDFDGLMLDIREELNDENSDLNYLIKSSLQKFEEFEVELIKFEEKKAVESKKIDKIITISGFVDRKEIDSVLEELNWECKTEISKDCKLLIVSDKNFVSDKIVFAKENGIKIMTLVQIKMLFL